MAANAVEIRKTVIIHPDCREAFLPESPDRCLSRRGVELSGLSELRSAYRIAREGERFHVVFFSYGGAGRLVAGGLDRRIGPGEFFVVPAGMPHEYLLEEEPWTVAWFHLDEDRRPRAEIGPLRTGAFDPDAGAGLRRTMESYLAERFAPDRLSGRALDALAELMLVGLARLIRAEDGGDPAAGRFSAVWEEVARSLARPWEVATLAGLAGYSVRQFDRINRRLYGEGPGEMLTRLRLDRGAEYLRATDYSLESIAELIGFSSAYALSNAFARVRGVRPSAERGGHRSASGAPVGSPSGAPSGAARDAGV